MCDTRNGQLERCVALEYGASYGQDSAFPGSIVVRGATQGRGCHNDASGHLADDAVKAHSDTSNDWNVGQRDS